MLPGNVVDTTTRLPYGLFTGDASMNYIAHIGHLGIATP